MPQKKLLVVLALFFGVACSDQKEELTKNCASKDGEACYKVALLAMKDGNEKDAFKFGEKACKLKLQKACKKLADIWEKRGKKSKAKKYYHLGCKAGDDLACLLSKK